MAGRLISTTATPLIYFRISHCFPSDTDYLIYSRHWGMRNSRRKEMNGICIKTPWLYRVYFSTLHSVFFSSYTTISQSCGHNGGTVTPLSFPQALPPFLFLPLYRHRSLLPCLPTRHTSTSPPRLCQGVSEWWSFSGPREWSCGFSVPHIRSRALAFCMLQEFGLAMHQALTTSSLTLTAASAELDKLPEAHSQYAVWNYADVSLFTFVFINFYKNICAFLRHPFRKCSLTNSEWKWLPICMIHSKS